jgi:hypothetical protein
MAFGDGPILEVSLMHFLPEPTPTHNAVTHLVEELEWIEHIGFFHIASYHSHNFGDVYTDRDRAHHLVHEHDRLGTGVDTFKVATTSASFSRDALGMEGDEVMGE